MRNKLLFGIIALVVGFAIFGIFYLVFPETTALMGWCAASGIIMAITLMANILLVSSTQSLTVKNAATAWALNLSTVVLFVWTLVFTFALGSYEDNQRSLNGLYIGYLIILILALILLLMANRGGNAAQEHNTAVQTNIADRDSLLALMRQIKLQYADIDTDPRSATNKAIAHNIDLMRNMPTNTLSSQQIFEAITQLKDSVATGNFADIDKANHNLSVVLKSLR